MGGACPSLLLSRCAILRRRDYRLFGQLRQPGATSAFRRPAQVLAYRGNTVGSSRARSGGRRTL